MRESEQRGESQNREESELRCESQNRDVRVRTEMRESEFIDIPPPTKKKYTHNSTMIFDSKFPLAIDNNSGMCWTHDPCRVTLQVFTDPYDNCSVSQLYQSMTDLVDPILKLFHGAEREVPVNNINNNCLENDRHRTPCLAVMLFLRGSDSDHVGGVEEKFRLNKARQLFHQSPWRFHHSEKVSQGHINALPQNSQDFYCTEPGLPLWALRQVHYGRQHIRFVLYSQEESWPDQLQFYSLLFGLQPELLREDFCLFTLYANEDYDVQFALKKQPGGLRRLDSVHIQIKVKEIGQLVPLFPNVCRPVSDTRWETTDHDGNVVVLNLIKTSHDHVQNKKSSRKAHSPPYSAGQLKSHCPPVGAGNNNDKLNLFHSEDSDFYSLTSSSEDFSAKTIHPTYSNVVNSESSSKFIFESTSSDLDIDLPIVQRRKHKEADETSLTLTTTSEESGIQMQHCSDDTSCCDDDALKPCLSGTSKHRDVKLKVRFKDEVQTFDDDTFSQHSSGIDSEGQSDSEMETKFSFTPLNKTCLHNDNTQNGVKLKTNTEKRRCPEVPTLNLNQQPSLLQQGNNTHQNEAHYVNSQSLLSISTSTHVNSKISNNGNNINPNSDKVFHNSLHQLVSQKQCHNNINAAAVQKDNTHSINQDTSKNRPQASKPFCDLKLSDDPDVAGHSMSRSPLKLGGQVHPPPPPVRDINTRLRSVSCSDQKGSNLVLDSRLSPAKDNNMRPRSVSCSNQKGPHLVSKQNGQQNFYFEFTPTASHTVTNSALTQVKNDQHQCKTLQFTLKYDSGLSSGQEQVGFYV
ncbi:hypothetical protein Btru_038085 [Bulinus truncatus]|nr:hypothetical protein Btru_038085 [Bulinus truncatus]